MVTHGRGIVCLPVAAWRLDELADPADGVDATAATTRRSPCRSTTGRRSTTGTSAHDRAVTRRRSSMPSVGPQDFHRPGHVFPLRAKEGGVLRRAGHTEAAVDLAHARRALPGGRDLRGR